MNPPTWLFGSRKTLTFALLLAFLLALGIRLYDLTDLPLDFNPTRQLFSMLKARGMYYALSPHLPAWHREIAIQQWQESPVIEPPLLEALTALSYLPFGENLAIPRLYSILFWLLGGIFLYRLAQDLTDPNGAFFSLLFYLFLPFGIYASRSFQPDPLMVMLTLAAVWSMWQWRTRPGWKWALTAGILNGLAILIKNVAVFPLLGAALGIVLERGIFSSLKDRQTWLVAALSIFPAGAYTLYGIGSGFLGGQFSNRFFPHLWKTAAFYLQWKGQLEGIFGFSLILLALASLTLLPRRPFGLLLGLWGGYTLYGFTFAYHITTHDYYHLPLIPIAALSLAPLAQVLTRLARTRQNLFWLRSATALGLSLVVALQLWTVRVELIRNDYRADAAYQYSIGEALGHTSQPSLSLAQDYGDRLEYWGWQPNTPWQDASLRALREAGGQTVDSAAYLQQALPGKRFFIITHLARLEAEPILKETLYQNYPIYAQGKGYVIFDLAVPLAP